MIASYSIARLNVRGGAALSKGIFVHIPCSEKFTVHSTVHHDFSDWDCWFTRKSDFPVSNIYDSICYVDADCVF